VAAGDGHGGTTRTGEKAAVAERLAYKNLFLAALPDKEIAALQPLLKPIDLRQGDLLSEPAETISNVLFVESGMISLMTTMQDGTAIEAATLGRESILGALSALGSHRANTRAIVQIAGDAYQMKVADFRAEVDKSAVLRNLVLLSSELMIAQMQQTAACNALHSVERRFCRWILQVRDRTDGDEIVLTHDFVAQMLAVRRPTVSLIAQEIQNQGLIRYSRGRITILDREGLERLACECVDALRTKTRRILKAVV
jgi:CRP-like cAMP-binding protein